MSILKKAFYDFDEKTGKATFLYRYKGYEFWGEADCHEDDYDMKSELVGLQLAENRAYLDFLKVRRRELQTRYETLQGVYNYLSDDKEFDITSSYGKKLAKEIEDTSYKLQNCRDGIKALPKMIQDGIDRREDLYQKIRERRKNENKGE